METDGKFGGGWWCRQTVSLNTVELHRGDVKNELYFRVKGI